jgi:hypothetical protein
MKNYTFKIAIILFVLGTNQILNAQNTSINGTTIGGNQLDIISKPCAIIINPTNKEIKEMTKAEGGDSMQTNNDNATLSISIIKSYLDSTKTFTIEKEAKGELKFKLIDGKIYTLYLDKLYWDVFLFNGESIPIKVTVTDFAREYINYMKLEK